MHLESSISGHVYRRQGPRADVWYAKWRGADGRQHKRRLGPAWSGRGRPAAGYLTKRLAEGELRRILDDEDQGVGIAAPAREITIAEAAVEWLRYAEFDRSCKPSTLVDYRPTLTRYVLPYLADVHLSDLTPQAVERWRARLTHGPSGRCRTERVTRPSPCCTACSSAPASYTGW